MRKYLFAFVVTLLGLLTFTAKAWAQCSYDYTGPGDPYYMQVDDPDGGRDLLVPRDGSQAIRVATCGASGCAAGTVCIIKDGGLLTPPHSPYAPGLLDGTCQTRVPFLDADFCCSLEGDSCEAPGFPCCDAALTCYQQGGPGVCRECVNITGGICTDDAECCTNAGINYSCNPYEGSCMEQPDLSAPGRRATCNTSRIAVGQICDYAWWDGDGPSGGAVPGQCGSCIGGTTAHATTAECYGTYPLRECNSVCTGLPNGSACDAGQSCACASGICNDDGSGSYACGAAASCVNTLGFICNETNAISTDDCCAFINGNPVSCTSSSCQLSGNCAIPGAVSEGSPCTTTSECCPGSTGLVCSGTTCTAGTGTGFECTQEGSCETDSCDYGQMCVNGYCTESPSCLASLEVIPYEGPIIDFNDFVGRIFGFLYPVGIILGLFFIGKSGYTIMTSEGNPQKIAEGKEELTSAVIGTLFILLSLVILRVIIRALLGATI